MREIIERIGRFIILVVLACAMIFGYFGCAGEPAAPARDVKVAVVFPLRRAGS